MSGFSDFPTAWTPPHRADSRTCIRHGSLPLRGIPDHRHRSLETDKNGFKELAFDPTMALLVINQHIFGADPGFPGVPKAIRDKNKTSIRVIAKKFLSPGEKLKAKGTLNLNLVVAVAGKVQGTGFPAPVRWAREAVRRRARLANPSREGRRGIRRTTRP
jgi:hypothetical protein